MKIVNFKQCGFTLIELMITVSIIGILAAISVPVFNDYILKSKFTVIYHETNQFRIPYQTLMSEGAAVQNFTPRGLNMIAQTQNCNFVIKAPSLTNDTINAIQCNIINISTYNGQYISLNKSLDNSWSCHASSGIPTKYLPNDCQP